MKQSKDFKADCGCQIHIIQWTSRRQVASVKNCPLHKAAGDLLKAVKALLPEGWGEDGTMDHMPGVKLAREAIAKAEGRIA